MERITLMRIPRVTENPPDPTPVDVLVTITDFLTEPAPEPLTDDPRDARYPGRMTAFPDTPDKEIF